MLPLDHARVLLLAIQDLPSCPARFVIRERFGDIISYGGTALDLGSCPYTQFQNVLEFLR
jgi:hypothetical protein